MDVLFLGTSAAEGWPALFCSCENCKRAAQTGGKNIRTRPSFLIDDRLMIDPGPDLHLHVLRYGLSLAGLEGILVTHAHADHVAVAEFNYTRPPFSHRDMTRPIPMYGNETVLRWFREELEGQDDLDIRNRYGLDLRPATATETFRIELVDPGQRPPNRPVARCGCCEPCIQRGISFW